MPLKSRYLVRQFLENAAKPIYANTTATVAMSAQLGRDQWPQIDDLHDDLPGLSKRHSPDYIPFDGMTISRSRHTGLFFVESVAARIDLSALSRDVILLSPGVDRHPVRYASGAWRQMPESDIWLHIRNAGAMFGPAGEYGFVSNGNKWDAPWHVETSPSSSNATDWSELKRWWDELAIGRALDAEEGAG